MAQFIQNLIIHDYMIYIHIAQVREKVGLRNINERNVKLHEIKYKKKCWILKLAASINLHITAIPLADVECWIRLNF